MLYKINRKIEYIERQLTITEPLYDSYEAFMYENRDKLIYLTELDILRSILLQKVVYFSSVRQVCKYLQI